MVLFQGDYVMISPTLPEFVRSMLQPVLLNPSATCENSTQCSSQRGTHTNSLSLSHTHTPYSIHFTFLKGWERQVLFILWIYKDLKGNQLQPPSNLTTTMVSFSLPTFVCPRFENWPWPDSACPPCLGEKWTDRQEDTQADREWQTGHQTVCFLNQLSSMTSWAP